MNSLLLKVIRLSALRQSPAVARQQRKSPYREKVFQYLRILTPLAGIPLWLQENKQFFLDGRMGKNSKAGAAFQELKESGVNEPSIWHQKLTKDIFLAKTLRVIVRLPWLLCFLVKSRKMLGRLDFSGLEALVGYAAYKVFFRRNAELIPIIISDISPYFHMQWSAALAVGNKVMWWQDDYHHFKGFFSSENYFPYPCYYAAVLNEHGLETIIQSCPTAVVFRRKTTVVKEFRTIPDPPKVGLATNVLFQATPEQMSVVEEVRKMLGVSDIYFRLHPNSKLHGSTNNPEWMHLAPKDEMLEDFAERVDVVVVGNSAVQLKLLCLGVPVVHTPALDPLDFDLYKYCKLGFSYGVENIKDLNIKNIRSFYAEQNISNKLLDYVNVNSPIPNLQEGELNSLNKS